MKQNKITKKEFLVFLSVITMFVFIVSLSSLYVSNLVQRGEVCGCIIPIPIMLVILSSLGVFVGSITYYLVFSKFSFEKKEMGSNLHKTLDFLDEDEKRVMEILISNPKGINQTRLSKKSGLSKVKTHRVLKGLVSKKIVKKVDLGRSKIIQLNQELKKVFSKG